MVCRYVLRLEDGSRFLLAARKRKKSTSSYYVISWNDKDLTKHSKGFLGKLRSNFLVCAGLAQAPCNMTMPQRRRIRDP